MSDTAELDSLADTGVTKLKMNYRFEVSAAVHVDALQVLWILWIIAFVQAVSAQISF